MEEGSSKGYVVARRSTMAHRARRLPNGNRVTDEISVGVLARTFPLAKVKAVLKSTGKDSLRQRELPAHVVVYYVLALSLWMESSCREVLRFLLEGLQWHLGPERPYKVTGKSGISQARSRLGWEALKQLHQELVRPVAQKQTRGAWYRQWRLVSLDGSTMEVADTPENVQEFGRPGASRGQAAYPLLRFVSLLENGTHVLFATQTGPFKSCERELAKGVLPELRSGMLCLADRYFTVYELWQKACSTGADLLWRAKTNRKLENHQPLPDGSYLSYIYPSAKARRQRRDGILVRVIEYRLEGAAGKEPFYRLLTTVLDAEQAPAQELAALYHERWEIETTLDEFKVHLRGAQMVLRSRTPDLVRQAFYGFLMTHFAIRGLMHEAALLAQEDPDRLSFVHAVRVVRRKLPIFVISPQRRTGGFASGGLTGNLGGTSEQQPWSEHSPRGQTQDEQISAPSPISMSDPSPEHQDLYGDS
jgi:hypothetical protein